MAPHVYWLLLALGLLMAEMATGTFYMLVLSVAFAIGGVAALLGLGEALQLMLSAAAGITGILFLRRAKAARPAKASSQNFDIGQPVQVIAWREDGTARVHFRGADWDAEPESADTPHAATLYIKAMRGSTLILTQHKS
jgi:membrane protein implicated in regulation of membrane protease activity